MRNILEDIDPMGIGLIVLIIFVIGYICGASGCLIGG